MTFNNFKIALRTLQKNKLYSIINVLGLTIGIAAVLLIFRTLNYELGFNKNFSNYDKIVKVVSFDPFEEGDDAHDYCVAIPAMKQMRTDIPQLQKVARVYEVWSNLTIPNPNGGAPLKKFNTPDANTALFADPEFLDIFDFKLLAGDRTSLLKDPSTIVLTKTWAEKCFDNWENAIGKTLLLDNLVEVKVTGVLKDLPPDCDFTFPYLVAYQTVEKNGALFFYGGNWGTCSSNNQVYGLLTDEQQLAAANDNLNKIGAKQYTNSDGKRSKFHLAQPLSTLHFDERYGHSGSHIISKSRLQVLGFIGLLILIIACFNFINLATAQATLRAKEVGVRKTLGSRPMDLIGQFMTETGFIVLVAVVLGANLASIAAPILKHVSDVPDGIPFLTDPKVIFFLGIVAIVVTLLSGLYPAIRLSKFQPVEALKSKVSTESFGGVSLRKGLVVTQFVIAQALIIGAIITINQLDYMQTKDLGFAKDLVYTFSFNVDEATLNKQNALKQSLLQIPNVETVSFSSDQPLSGNTWDTNFSYSSRPEREKFNIAIKFADEDYKNTYGLKLLAGRWLEKSDTMKNCVLNSTTLKKLGVDNPEEAIGKTITLGRQIVPIIGVTEDFHTHSLHKEHLPLIMVNRKEYYWEAGVKIRPTDIKGTVAAIKKSYDAILPEQVLVGSFLDEDIAQFYKDDARMASTCRGFSLLAILISCLGLFGLATHTANQRIKEIGIRKVLGASISGIVGLLSKDFLKLVLIALVIAGPIAYLFMKEWLNNFQFRIDIGWSVFVLSGLIALFIAFATVSVQAIRAAVANPIKALKSD